MFSTPEGRDGWPGNGKTRISTDGCVEIRGSRIGTFLGVTKTVILKPWRRS
uniref:Uncharacterized protein n=1 Tax=Solanum lycopersicum TaxID=4081 RepID=A0A3Q7GE89_SOLLC